ncbi:MAG: tRNA (guanosine(46)-N7)-methyltransferase TrmB [Pseudomonadota bacterium]
MSDQHREIKSFVQRPGRLTPAQRSALETLAPRFVVDFEPGGTDPAALFERDAPLMLEIGFGNGDSLVELAAAQRNWNVIGIEVHEPGVGHCLLMADKHELAHFKIIRHDAIEVLREQLPARCVSRLNLYFPDPWPKKRHHKRRILAPKFLDLVANALTEDGTLHIATDWQNYAEHIDEQMAADARYHMLERVNHNGDQPLERPGTKFERRGLALGHEIVDWKFTLAGTR